MLDDKYKIIACLDVIENKIFSHILNILQLIFKDK